MKDMLTYQDFIGSVHFNAEDKVFYGKIEGVDDLVTFEGKTVDEIVEAFHEAVEDYIVLCKETGKQLLKSYKGSLSIRIPPELHREVAERSLLRGVFKSVSATSTPG